MKIVNLNKERTIKGLQVRTNNKHEMDPACAKIGNLARRFDEHVVVDYRGGARVYGVYSEYEADLNGMFTVLIGADRIDKSQLELSEVIIPKGKYLVFTGSGQVPQVVIDTWKKVWTYFEETACDHQRAYTTDFEFYKNASSIEIYISIK